ncbi:PIN domain-like protein [Lentinula aciculospora]|uniref:Exonuclease 1 n=1 Tax=Lentinula aciculospora TaxID=153920 RepID=A0A9W9DX74_9AGAR|nr:PIN domain-like protein [Lentinula aciculospora]
MGVLGLTPFIQKTCPEVIKRLPDRLQGFSGKRIVLDGTLLTQRFHFAQIPHPYRHVLGWYRLIKELEQFGVEAICVFDGKGRNLAKAQEALRRKNTQRLAVARAVIENERLTRLNQISSAVRNIAELSSKEKAQVSSALTQLIHNKPEQGKRDILSQIKEATMESALSENLSWVDSDSWATNGFIDDWYINELSSGATPLEVEEALRMGSSVVSDSPSLLSFEQFADSEGPPSIPVQDVIPFSKTPQRTIETSQQNDDITVQDSSKTSTVDNILSIFKPLFLEYQSSIPKLTSNPIHAAKTIMQVPIADPDTVVDEAELEEDAVQKVYEMSKRQSQLTLQEGQFWDNLTTTLGLEPEVAPRGDSSSHNVDDHYKMLQELTHKSNLISESYRISAHHPTSQTYAESKEILKAMGVPCVDCDGPFEAEALASSLVLNGYADYVASEDTDVIIYEAPLIRNITSRQQPLLVISGAELRSMLNLTRSMFVDFALLLGTDFSQRIRQVGPMRALDFIRAHGSIEKVIEVETRYKPKMSTQDYLRQVDMARKVFETLPPVPEDAVMRFRDGFWEGNVSDAGQVLFVMGKYGLSREVDWDSEDALKGNYFDDDPGQQ